MPTASANAEPPNREPRAAAAHARSRSVRRSSRAEQVLHARQDRGGERSISCAQRGSRARTVSDGVRQRRPSSSGRAPGRRRPARRRRCASGDGGWRRMTSASTPGAKFCSGTIDRSDTIKRDAPRPRLGFAAPRRAADERPASPSTSRRPTSTRRRGRRSRRGLRAARRARQGAAAAAARPATAVVLAADTVVVVGRPDPRQAATRATPRAMLRAVGRRPRGADRRRRAPRRARGCGGRRRRAYASSPLTEAEIAWYVATRRAGRQGGRLRHPGPGVAVRRPDRRLVVERRRAAGRDGLPACSGRRRRAILHR